MVVTLAYLLVAYVAFRPFLAMPVTAVIAFAVVYSVTSVHYLLSPFLVLSYSDQDGSSTFAHLTYGRVYVIT